MDFICFVNNPWLRHKNHTVAGDRSDQLISLFGGELEKAGQALTAENAEHSKFRCISLHCEHEHLTFFSDLLVEARSRETGEGKICTPVFSVFVLMFFIRIIFHGYYSTNENSSSEMHNTVPQSAVLWNTGTELLEVQMSLGVARSLTETAETRATTAAPDDSKYFQHTEKCNIKRYKGEIKRSKWSN